MRVFTTLPQEDLRKVAPAARWIEAEGYDGAASMENKHDPFLALAVAGSVTERIELHTSVAIAFARTPMAVAETGWDLAGAHRRSLCRRPRLAGPRPQRAAVFGAVDAAGAAHARIRPGSARDLALLENRR